MAPSSLLYLINLLKKDCGLYKKKKDAELIKPANISDTFVVVKPDLTAESAMVTDTFFNELDARYDGFKKIC